MQVNAALRAYALALRVGGLGLGAIALVADSRWLDAPAGVLIATAAIVLLRAMPIRLSKYSYLTQTGLAVLSAALLLGPAAAIASLMIGVVVADALILRKDWRNALVNAGREVIGFEAAFGCYAVVLAASGHPGFGFDHLPAAFALLAAYFLATRALFYFTLLVRGKLAKEEQLLILRWEVVSFLVTVAGTAIIVGAVLFLDPTGWVPVLVLLGVLGLLTRNILEEAIAAEDLNKVHMLEMAIAGNVTLQASLEQVERLAYRLLDWGDFRIYRREGDVATLMYRAVAGRPRRGVPPADLAPVRLGVLEQGRVVSIRDTRRDPRFPRPDPDVRSVVVQPLRFGDELLGTLELDHFKANAYQAKDLSAVATIAAQISTAIHIAELRRPLSGLVSLIGEQVAGLARATESLRTAAATLAETSRSMMRQVGEQEEVVRSGRDETASLASVSEAMAQEGSRAAAASARAAELAGHNSAVVGQALARLAQFKTFVGDSSREVRELGDASRRITGFIGSIREIADATNLIALNAAIEAARAGKEGRGFAVVADEVRQLAAQSLAAAREADTLVGAVVERIGSVAGQMQVGNEVAADVEQVSGAAAGAFDSIVTSTREAGAHAQRVASMAVSQQAAFRGLSDRFTRVADGTGQMSTDARALAEQARETAAGQAELERAIQDLGELATELQQIARHFAAGA